MDENTKFMQEYLSQEDRGTFFDCFVLPPEERIKKARELSKDVFWLGYQVAKQDDRDIKEHYMNYIAALCSFLRGAHPQKGWIKLG